MTPEFSQPTLAFLLLEFTSLADCQVVVKHLVGFIHHNLFVNCHNHDDSYAFWFEHWMQHNHFREVPPSRPKVLE
tara:strand:+ start:4711 stop:4935 length:225 start_codon:yes stop_codon:yes gene_type:complete